MRLVLLRIAALAFGFAGCANPVQVAQQRQALAAQQQALFERNVEIWLASSPEGTPQQWQSDLATRSGLTDLQKDALKDQDVGVPLTVGEQQAIANMTQEQKRAIARLNLMKSWVKAESTAMQQQAQWEQGVRLQQQQIQAQHEQAQLLCYQQMRNSNTPFGSALAAETCSRY